MPRRAAMIHLYFNLIGTVVFMITVLSDRCCCAFSVYDTDGDTGNDRDHAQCVQYHGDTCMAAILQSACETCLSYDP